MNYGESRPPQDLSRAYGTQYAPKLCKSSWSSNDHSKLRWLGL